MPGSSMNFMAEGDRQFAFAGSRCCAAAWDDCSNRGGVVPEQDAIATIVGAVREYPLAFW